MQQKSKELVLAARIGHQVQSYLVFTLQKGLLWIKYQCSKSR